MSRSVAVAALIGAVLLVAGSAAAHSLQPGFLLVQETDAGAWEVHWTAPQAEPELIPHVTGGCALDRLGMTWTLRCSGEEPGELRVPGMRLDTTEVVVRVAPEEGAPGFAILTQQMASMELDLQAAAAGEEHAASPSFVGWVWLGVEHILIGTDHLLFVLALVLLITGARELVWTVTSFTIAHSITLAAASLGALSLPSGPVEATIALSIVLLAVELAGDEESLTHRKPWLVAFAFGLLHGFGFAGALGELGLPEDQVWMPLLSFNLGVEAGQLAFVAVVIGPVIALRKAPRWAQLAPVYAIGTVAMAWTVERVSGFWG